MGVIRGTQDSPAAFALNRGLGDQMTRQFEQLYGRSPYASVEPSAAFALREMLASYYETIGTNIGKRKLEV